MSSRAGSPGEAMSGDAPVGTRLDEWWGRMLRSPFRQRLWQWGGPIAVTLLAAVLRLWNLGNPHSLVFDETYYVKDSWTLLHLGYESAWPEEPNPDFEAGHVDGFLTDPAFVVHPPLGKWLVALGLAVFGAEDSVGWRISTAMAGILAVALVCLVAWMLFRSTTLATIAGGLMAIDGHAIVLSRVALLDNFLMLFALLGFIAVLLDRWHSRGRLDAWLAARRGRPKDLGPALWWRPWLITAGLLFGLASAVKWSGLYFLAVFAIYTLVVDAVARRRAGIMFWVSGTILKQAPVSFLLTVPIAAAAHLASWTGWFVTGGGYYRHWAEEAGNAWQGPLAWVPADLQSFWHYQVSAYNFHVGLSTPHSYSADAWTWLFLTRPTSFNYSEVDGTASLITSLANPLIWWSAGAALVYLVYRLIRYREWRVGLILTGVAAGYLPWLLYPSRTMFQFYAISFEPFLILGLTMALGIILGRRTDPTWRRLSGIRLVAVFLIAAALVSAFFYPVWAGIPMPELFVRSHFWLPGWR
ncbi:dolichyl-phosphate-mannose--protein mannosyltransferase [Homoserinimonas sp. A520]